MWAAPGSTVERAPRDRQPVLQPFKQNCRNSRAGLQPCDLPCARRTGRSYPERPASRRRTMRGVREREIRHGPDYQVRLATDRCRRSQQRKDGLRVSGFAPVG